MTVLAIAAVAAAAVGLTGASGATGQLSRFQMIPGGTITGSHANVVGLSNKQVTYILEMSAKPVAAANAASKAAGRGPLTFTQRAALTRQIRNQQAPVIAAVQRLGASVRERFHGVYNGISVSLPQNQAWKLSSISGVKAVYASRIFTKDVAPGDGIPLVNGPQTWGGTPGFTGTGMKIADLDTGLDYMHADFGGFGTVASFNCADAHSTEDPATVDCGADGGLLSQYYGPSAPKVKGGTDLVGDDYNASGSGSALIPQPDPNPLDCNGHGSHTAGTAAGFGVDHNGATYSGSYTTNTIDNESFIIPPGVAPQADLYAVRVFGCAGSVNDDVLIAAMDWAFTNNMDVVNMSLGASFGSPDDPDSVAASNLAANGVITVLSSGNSGPNPYITGSPAAGVNAISTAANDSTASFPGADFTLNLTSNSSISGSNGAIVANGVTVPAGTYNLHVVYSAPNVISLGCSVADDEAGNGGNPWTSGDILVVARGTCARVAKAIFAQQAGAGGVIMVNNSTAFPPYEGPITSNPDTGIPYTVTIPMYGVKGGSSPSTSTNGTALRAADGGTITVAANAGIVNANYLGLASFTSWGPTAGGLMKPEVTAPGVSIISAGVGKGNGGVFLSGTSMAAPHDTGVAALVKQAHNAKWTATGICNPCVSYFKDAIVNTANRANVLGYQGKIRGAGAGEINAYNATHTNVTADGSPSGTASLSFGVPDFTKGYKATETIHLTNFSSTKTEFTVGKANKQGIKHTLSCVTPNSWTPTKVVVPAHGTADIQCTLIVYKGNAADPVGQFGDYWGSGVFDDAAGLVTFTPVHQTNHNIPLVVPYYAVPTAVSNVSVSGLDSSSLANGATANAIVTDKKGNPGYADYFSWGGSSDTSVTDIGSADLLADGVSSTGFTGTMSGSFVTFALQTTKAWTNPAEDVVEIDVDVNGDSNHDYEVYSYDHGLFTTGTTPDGEALTIVCPVAAGSCVAHYLAGDMFNGTTMELAVQFADLCMASNPCVADGTAITYNTYTFDRNGGADQITNNRSYDIYHPSFTNNGEDYVTRNATVSDPTTINQAAWAANPQLGILVLEQDNQNTIGEAQTISLSF